MMRTAKRRRARPERDELRLLTGKLTDEELRIAVRGGDSTSSGITTGFEDGKLELSGGLGAYWWT